MVNCSIIVPVHNEYECLEELIIQFWKNLGKLNYKIGEIHLMENGSSDDTFQVCKNLEKRFPGLVFAHEIPIPSYGEAIKQGKIKYTFANVDYIWLSVSSCLTQLHLQHGQIQYAAHFIGYVVLRIYAG